MANKLVLIYDEPFSTSLKIVANNERDLMDYLSENFKLKKLKNETIKLRFNTIISGFTGIKL